MPTTILYETTKYEIMCVSVIKAQNQLCKTMQKQIKE